jgi:hypothetical protein
MVTTLPVLAASLLLGQTVQAPVTSGAQAESKVYVYNNGVLVPYSDGQRGALMGQQPTTDSHHPILSKIHNWFSKRSSGTNSPNSINTHETPPPPTIINSPIPSKGSGNPLPTITTPPASSPSTPPGDFPRKMPTIQSSTRSNEGAVANGDTISPAALKSLPTAAKTPILPGNANRIGRDEKFEWITGQLEMEKGQFVLYYATPETVDTYHGRIQLSAQKVDMHSFSGGDLISVRGHLHTGAGAAVYQLTSADLIEKAKK